MQRRKTGEFGSGDSLPALMGIPPFALAADQQKRICGVGPVLRNGIWRISAS